MPPFVHDGLQTAIKFNNNDTTIHNTHLSLYKCSELQLATGNARNQGIFMSIVLVTMQLTIVTDKHRKAFGFNNAFPWLPIHFTGIR